MIGVKPQESPAIFPTVEKPTNLFSSKPFRNLLAIIYPLVWEKTLKEIRSGLLQGNFEFRGGSIQTTFDVLPSRLADAGGFFDFGKKLIFLPL